jgi:hypothetical protein
MFMTEQLEALKTGESFPVLVFEMEFTSGTKRAWNGDTPLTVDGKTFEPFHGGLKIDNLSAVIDGTASSTTLSLPGLPMEPSIAGLSVLQADEADGKPIFFYLAFVDGNWQAKAGLVMLSFGFMSVPLVDRTPMTEEQGPTQGISLTIDNLFGQRARSVNGRVTDTDQQRLYPGDRAFERVVEIASGKVVVYPDY